MHVQLRILSTKDRLSCSQIGPSYVIRYLSTGRFTPRKVHDKKCEAQSEKNVPSITMRVVRSDPSEPLWLRAWISCIDVVRVVSFLPCDAMHKRGYCQHAVSLSVCLSVCPSRSWVASKRIKISLKFFSPPGSHTILVFPYWTGWRYSDGNPLTRASNARGYEKDDFRPISRSISETVIVRWAHAARQFVSVELSFHPYNI